MPRPALGCPPVTVTPVVAVAGCQPLIAATTVRRHRIAGRSARELAHVMTGVVLSRPACPGDLALALSGYQLRAGHDCLLASCSSDRHNAAVAKADCTA